MLLLYSSLFLLLNFVIYKIFRQLKTDNFRIVFIIILVIIGKIVKDTKVDYHFSVTDLFLFSIGIPFFASGIKYVSQKMKQRKMQKKLNTIELRAEHYLATKNYVAHITILITVYQLLTILTEDFKL